jgi:hypothetical protein
MIPCRCSRRSNQCSPHILCAEQWQASCGPLPSAGTLQTAVVILTLICGVSSLPGCGSGGRVKVTGTVTVDGEPLESGSISFRPVDIGAAPSSGGGVAEGRFDLPADKGLVPGKYRVTIAAFKKTGRMFLLGTPESVPIKFNETDKLEATIVAGGDNCFTFPLTTAK